MSKETYIKDLEKWFHAKVKLTMKDLIDRAEAVDLSSGEMAAILGGELIQLTAEVFALGTTMPPEKAGEMFAEGIRLTRQLRSAEKEKEAAQKKG